MYVLYHASAIEDLLGAPKSFVRLPIVLIQDHINFVTAGLSALVPRYVSDLRGADHWSQGGYAGTPDHTSRAYKAEEKPARINFCCALYVRHIHPRAIRGRA